MRLRVPKFGLPLLGKELAEMAQRRRTYWVRVAFALLMFSMSALVFLPTYRMARGSTMGLLGKGAELLDVLYVLEWVGLCLFVPATVSGALAAEKERNTLQLLFLTRLRPWTILLEKLLSRFVPIATFLLVTLPLLFVAYLMGGLTAGDLEFAAVGLFATAFQVGCLALFCSAYCATSASAIVMSYALLILLLLSPFIEALSLVTLIGILRPVGGSQSALLFWLESARSHEVLEPIMMSPIGINFPWLFERGTLDRPFHTSWFPVAVIASSGGVLLLLARWVLVRRMAPIPKHRVRRLFQWLDRTFSRLNERYARGIVFVRPSNDLPEENPVAWREKRRGNLGRVNHLIRILLVLEFPILAFTVLLAVTGGHLNYTGMSVLAFLLWTIAILVVFVRAAGLIAAEKACQTLDVLLTTPLSLSALAGDKMRGVRRVMFLVSVPILFHAVFVSYLQASTGSSRGVFREPPFEWGEVQAGFYVFAMLLNLPLVLALVAQLGFLCGLRAKTQGRAVVAALSVFIAWSVLPFLFLLFAETSAATLYLSPMAGVVVNEFPDLAFHRVQVRHSLLGQGTESGAVLDFRMPFYWLTYAAALAALVYVNRVWAARALLRSPPNVKTFHVGNSRTGRLPFDGVLPAATPSKTEG
jgi:ABC-type transport system involved in multi-copper enzyme maturation permease subunit